MKQRSALFNRDNVKPWKAYELKFDDDKVAEAEVMKCKLEECQTNIITNIATLKRKLSSVNDEIAESTRKLKRLQENRCKTEMGKENRLHAKASEVLKVFTNGKVIFDAKSINTKIVKKADLRPKKELIPRYHLKALSFLIENNWFDEDTLPVVQRLLDELTNLHCYHKQLIREN